VSLDLRRELNDVQTKIRIYLSAGRPDAAEKMAKAALADHGPLANIHNLLGVVYHSQSRFGEALKEFQRSIQINPAYIEAGLNLVATLCDLSCYEDARRVHAQVMQHVPQGRKQTQLVLGRIANQHAQNGRMYEESGMVQDAIHEFRRALALYENLPDVRLALSRALVKAGQRDKALMELEELVKKTPSSIGSNSGSCISSWGEIRMPALNGKWSSKSTPPIGLFGSTCNCWQNKLIPNNVGQMKLCLKVSLN
jgi:tetratricopeptide (TPR) repeat protein